MTNNAVETLTTIAVTLSRNISKEKPRKSFKNAVLKKGAKINMKKSGPTNDYYVFELYGKKVVKSYVKFL